MFLTAKQQMDNMQLELRHSLSSMQGGIQAVGGLSSTTARFSRTSYNLVIKILRVSQIPMKNHPDTEVSKMRGYF